MGLTGVPEGVQERLASIELSRQRSLLTEWDVFFSLNADFLSIVGNSE